ncbi:MAG: AAA family ATPase [Planctomycetaceae bacterium]|nr:AAA family ATPase [Planctomycetaceae bacterium]MCB9949570.1 AAA family ATPase [Planctomycetaceae bacterium]
MSNNNNNITKIQDELEDDPELQNPDEPTKLQQFDFDETLQQLIVSLLYHHDGILLDDFVAAGVPLERFVKKSHRILAEILCDYHATTGAVAPKEIIISEATKRTREHSDSLLTVGDISTLIDYYEPNVSTVSWAKKKLVEFEKIAAFRTAMSKATKLLMEGKPAQEIVETTANQLLIASEFALDEQEQDVFSVGDGLYDEPPEWLVHNLIRRNEISVLFGASGCRKTWLAIDAAISIATGTDFLGAISAKQGNVLYICSEGGSSFPQRLRACYATRGFEIEDLQNLKFMKSAFDLSQKTEAMRLAKKCKQIFESVDLIVIDTLSKNFAGDGDSNAEINTFINNVELIRRETNAHVMTIHHTGHSNTHRERGGSSLRAGVDTSILVERSEEGIRSSLKCCKQKSGNEFATITVDFDQVLMPELPIVDGEYQTGLVGKLVHTPQNDANSDDFEQLVVDVIGDAEMSQGELVGLVMAKSGFGDKKTRARLQDLANCPDSRLKIKKGEKNSSVYYLTFQFGNGESDDSLLAKQQVLVV